MSRNRASPILLAAFLLLVPTILWRKALKLLLNAYGSQTAVCI